MSPRGRPKKRKITIRSRETRIMLGIILIGIGITVLMADTLTGRIPELIFLLVGEGITLVGIFSILTGLRLLGFTHKITEDSFLTGLFGLSIVYMTFLGYLRLVFNARTVPGLIGVAINDYLWTLFGSPLEAVILAAVTLAFLSMMAGPQLLEIIANAFNKFATVSISLVTRTAKALASLIRRPLKSAPLVLEQEPSSSDEPQAPQILTEETVAPMQAGAKITASSQDSNSLKAPEPAQNLQLQQESQEPSAAPASTNVDVKFGPSLVDKSETQNQEEDDTPSWIKRFINMYTSRFLNWIPPKIREIFLPPQKDSISSQEIEEVTRRIEEVLESFKIHARVSKVFVGPSVIQYALNIATGVKVAKVRGLAKDIALAIAAPSDSIRIDTIAGTSLIGIEVPRRNPRTVRAIEVIGSEEFLNSKYELPLAIGKNIHGKAVVLNLYDMPHILIAGATGSGKSVAINTILAGLLTKFNPDQLRLIMVDPKMVEMEPYNDIPHLLVPVITDMNQTVTALDWLIFEMQERYRLFKHHSVRNLKEYNAMAEQKLPWIILVIDEMADLILTKRNEVETKIVRLAQLARATGIHLILATQRPSVNVITGLIKANIPARIALAVTSGVDSRVILDTVGAESLLGKGDMLIKTPNTTRLQRVQGAFVSTEEINKLTEFLRTQALKLREGQKDWYVQELLSAMSGAGPTSKPGASTISFGASNQDPLLKDAIELVVREQKVSASALQRYLKIGFNRAARLIDEMEKLGVVSPLVGNKRKVLVSSLEELDAI